MVAPWQETAIKVVVEFQKRSRGPTREIALTHRPDVLPQQLYGRIPPQVWAAFITDVHQLALQHPYTARPTAKQCCGNLIGLCSWMCIGFGCFEGDAGDYNLWMQQVAACVDRYQPQFAQGGCRLSVQRVHGSYWVQVDVDPNMAVGYAVPPPQASPYPYPPPPQQQQQQQPYGYNPAAGK